MVYQYQPVNPLDAFAQSFQMVRGIQDDNTRRQQEQVAQQQAQATQAAFAQDVQAWQQNPSREGWAQLQFKYPQLAERAKPLAEVYGERGKSAIIGVGTQFLSAQGDARRGILENAVEAAKNSRIPEVVGVLEEALKVYDTDPAAAEVIVRTALIREDGDLYDSLFKRGERVQNYLDFVDLVGQEAALEIAGVAPKDGVQVLPNGMVIAGRDSPLAKQLAGGASTQLPTVTTKEQLDALPAGTEFIGPDGVKRVKKGGGGSNATGNFR